MASQSAPRAFPGFDQVFVVREGRGSPFCVDLEFPVDDSRLLTRGEIATPKDALVARWSMGGKAPTDVIWTTSAHPIIVHARVVDLLLDHRFTGWGTYPVEVYGRSGEVHPDYHGLIFRGRCGLIDHSKSEEVMRQMPAKVVPFLRGLYFDTETWDGSDFFMPGVEKWRLITGDVARVVLGAKVRGIYLEAAADVELSKWMMNIGKG